MGNPARPKHLPPPHPRSVARSLKRYHSKFRTFDSADHIAHHVVTNVATPSASPSFYLILATSYFPVTTLPYHSDGIYRGLEAALYDHFWANADDDAEITAATVDFLLETARAASGHGSPRILEAGCGSGRILAPLLAKGADAIGIDESSPMIQKAIACVGADRAIKSSIIATPFDASSFDALVAPGFTLMLVSDTTFDAFITEAKRLLTPSGLLIFDWFIPWDEIADDSLTADEDDWSPWEESKAIGLPTAALPELPSAHTATYEQRSRIDRLRQIVIRNQRFTVKDKSGKTLATEESIQNQRWFFPAELTARLAPHGLVIRDLIGDYEDKPAGDWNTVLTAVIGR